MGAGAYACGLAEGTPLETLRNTLQDDDVNVRSRALNDLLRWPDAIDAIAHVFSHLVRLKEHVLCADPVPMSNGIAVPPKCDTI